MKTIGIKLADGSFYPVLEEGSAQTKKLELTTANNNQTKVMVDLYRSATCSMDDAEYVDSLQIENLIEHPNGEAEIAFTVSLDEDNQLDAQIVDEETGNSSVAEKIQLVSRTIEERLNTDEFGINETEEPEMEETEVSDEDIALAEEGEPEVEETAEDDSNTGAVIAAAAGGAAAGAGLMALANALNSEDDKEDEGLASFNPEEDSFDTQELFEDQGEAIFDDIETDDTDAEEVTEAEITEASESAAEEPSDMVGFDDSDTIFGDMTETSEFDDMFNEEESTADEDLIQNETVVEDNAFASDDTIADDIFAETPADNADDTIADETIADDNLDIFADMNLDSDKPADTDSDDTIVTDDVFAEASDDTAADETLITDDIFADDMFADDSNTDETITEENSEDIFSDMNLDDMDFESDSEPAAGGISFTGLYDKETEMGDSSFDEDEDTKKKTKAPVIICLICAIICIVAVILILFVIPSPCNVLKKNAAKDNTEVVAEPAPAAVEEPVVKEEPVPAAKEDEVIVIEKAEEVVPVQPEPAVKKPENIVYKIKWGDTLWDIAGTYYKNPWKYKYIARYNGIKNPDHIISGTKIIIPAE